jgi:DNA-binding beta-propeller fold protein YncE
MSRARCRQARHRGWAERRNGGAIAATILILPLVLGIAAWASPATAGPVPTIYVANAGNPSTVTAVDSATKSVEKSIAIHDGTTVSVGVTPKGTRAYALVVGSDEVGSPGVLVPISTTTNTTGKAIGVGVNPSTFAFNPNGRYAYVVDGFDAATTAPNAPGTITPVNLADEAAGRPIKVGTNPGSIAITPNGQSAYVTDSNAINGDPTTITPIDLATDTPGKAIHVAARGIAITLNGVTAFAFGRDEVVPIATATNLPGKAIVLEGIAQVIALAPDGQTAWALTTPDPGLEPGSSKVSLTSINTATDQIGKVVPLTGMPTEGQFFVAITPNGAHIYVLGQGSGKSASILVDVDTATDRAGLPIKVGTDATALAANPDNKFVYVLTPGNDYQGPPITPQPRKAPGSLIPVATATDTVGNPIKVGLLASAMAITP